jgi:hypothetical protein
MRTIGGKTLIEAVLAPGVVTVASIGLMIGIGYMQMENRGASQRMPVASIAAEILDLSRALPNSNIAISTAAVPVYLKGSGTATPSAAWLVSHAGQIRALPVEDVNSSSEANPAHVAEKLPLRDWSASFVPIPLTPGVQQINVRIQSKLYAATNRPRNTYEIGTKVCTDNPRL